MNEARVRALVPVIIIVAAIGVGVYVWTRMGSGSVSVTGSGTISEEIEPDPKLSQTPGEPATEPATEQVSEQAPQLTPPTVNPSLQDVESRGLSAGGDRGQAQILVTGSGTISEEIEPDPIPISDDDKLKNALTKAADSEDYTALGTVLAEVYKRYPQGKKEFAEIESRAYVKATSYLDQEKNVEKARAAADAVYGKYPFGWRFKYLRVRVLERLGRDAFAVGDLASAEKHALAMLGMEFRPEGANLMADIYLNRIDATLAKGDKAAAKAAYDEIKDYQVSLDLRAALDERLEKIQ